MLYIIAWCQARLLSITPVKRQLLLPWQHARYADCAMTCSKTGVFNVEYSFTKVLAARRSVYQSFCCLYNWEVVFLRVLLAIAIHAAGLFNQPASFPKMASLSYNITTRAHFPSQPHAHQLTWLSIRRRLRQCCTACHIWLELSRLACIRNDLIIE